MCLQKQRTTDSQTVLCSCSARIPQCTLADAAILGSYVYRDLKIITAGLGTIIILYYDNADTLCYCYHSIYSKDWLVE